MLKSPTSMLVKIIISGSVRSGSKISELKPKTNKSWTRSTRRPVKNTIEKDKSIIYRYVLSFSLCETRTQPTQKMKNGINRAKELASNPTVP